MSTRSQRRLLYFALLLFLLTGLFIVEKRPHKEVHHSNIFSSIQDIIRTDSSDRKSGHASADQAATHDSAKLENDPYEEVKLEWCTAWSPSRGFIDLRGLSNVWLEGKAQPWLAKDYEFRRNFTLGICSSPIKRSHLDSMQFKDNVNSSEVGAYYVDPSTQKHVSLGEISGKPVFKGRKLMLNYENGSYCDSVMAIDGQRLRRSTVLIFTCDREMLNKAHVSYIASSHDCSFTFEVRSHYACPTAAKADNLAAIWIFLLILLAALLVFFSGSIFIRSLKTPKPSFTSSTTKA